MFLNADARRGLRKTANLETAGLDDLMLDLEAIMDIPDEVAEKILLAEAEIVERVQKETGKAMGVHRTGVTLAAITHGKMKRASTGDREVYVYPQGVNAEGNRNAEVAFINEYGKRGQKARPFIRTANEKSADEAADAAALVYSEFLASKNL